MFWSPSTKHRNSRSLGCSTTSGGRGGLVRPRSNGAFVLKNPARVLKLIGAAGRPLKSAVAAPQRATSFHRSTPSQRTYRLRYARDPRTPPPIYQSKEFPRNTATVFFQAPSREYAGSEWQSKYFGQRLSQTKRRQCPLVQAATPAVRYARAERPTPDLRRFRSPPNYSSARRR